MSDPHDPFDELAAMFLTSPAETTGHREPRRSVAGTCVTTELLIVGHLPVRAGLWLTPYADALAREIGTTTLLRLDNESASIQVLRGPIGLESEKLDHELSGAINKLGLETDLWIVCSSSGTPSSELICNHFNRITILTSADEAAIVAAYKIIKELTQDVPDGHAVPPIGLAVVGANETLASATVDRLNRTTLSFLGVEVRLTVALPRIDAGVKSSCYVDFADQAPPVFDDVMRWIEYAKEQAESRSVEPEVAGRIPHAQEIEDLHEAERILRTPMPIAPKPSQPPQISLPTTEKPAEPVRVATEDKKKPTEVSTAASMKLSPKIAVEVEPKETVHPHEPDEHGQPVSLSKYVKGLTSLPVRSPGHEHVELAVDSKGRLHLLGREAIMRDLKIVESWTRSHSELIAMACPQHQIDSAGRAVCHVFTDEPARLSDLHRTDLLLHVLAPVNVEGKTGWYSAPLNTV